MTYRWVLGVFLTASGVATTTMARSHSNHSGSAGASSPLSRHHDPSPAVVGGGSNYARSQAAAVVGLPWWYWPPIYSTVGPNGPVTYTPFAPVFVPQFLPVAFDGGAIGGPMPVLPGPVNPVAARPKRPDPAKGAQLVTIGDRLFRVGNFKRAFDRYEQAARANPEAAAPHLRLAQVSLVRGHFQEAADEIRVAVAVEPGWLVHAPDIQSIYGEPADFARQIAKLESRVLVEPNDRDAWLVLGAQLYLSGQTRRASDIFLRLSDRKPDAALTAFIDASSPPENLPK